MATHAFVRLAFTVAERAVLALQVAPPAVTTETLDVTLDGDHVDVEEVATAEGRTHLVRVGSGDLVIEYTMSAEAATSVPGEAGPVVYDDEGLRFLRQSRYCPSDALEGFARRELDGADAHAVASWVFERLAYEPGSSRSLDTAVETLVSGQGVCRDYAHLTVSLCRALGIPARFTSVYAPGLSPMDFHAVVEVRPGAEWEVLDATRLAPRQTLVRIATGRDAADTAFATTLQGDADLTWSEISAVSDGDLPIDDHTGRIALA